MYPKIIHQTYKTSIIPEHWERSRDYWKKFHSDYTYMFWTDEDIREFIKKFYPDFLELHDQYPYNIQRADMIRYFILYHYGGIYSDLDLYPSESISDYLHGYTADVLLVNSGNVKWSCFTNSFMISKKHATFWLKVHEELKKPLPLFAIGKHLEVMFSTGPTMLNKVAQRYKMMIATLPSHLFMAYSSNDDFKKIKKDAILHPLVGKSWNSWDSALINFVYKN